MRKKGFTLIELLVVIAIIAMLLAILMPALNKVKSLAQRLVCGTNVKGLGTAMLVYAQDFNDEYPMQGGRGDHRWSEVGSTYQWYFPDKDWSDPPSKYITVSASLYLLVRNADVDPKSFICPSGGETEFKGVGGNADIDIVQLWDFGGKLVNESIAEGTIIYNDGKPKEHVSYAFQLPYSVQGFQAHPASVTASASTAIMADKNPWQDPKLEDAHDPLTAGNLAYRKSNYAILVSYLFPILQGGLGGSPADWPDSITRESSTAWQVQIANSQPHNREGQNVLFGDGHSSFESRPDVSYQNDNIYTMWAGTAVPEYNRRTGINRPGTDPKVMPTSEDGPASYPKTSEDTLLVNDDVRTPPPMTD